MRLSAMLLVCVVAPAVADEPHQHEGGAHEEYVVHKTLRGCGARAQDVKPVSPHIEAWVRCCTGATKCEKGQGCCVSNDLVDGFAEGHAVKWKKKNTDQPWKTGTVFRAQNGKAKKIKRDADNVVIDVTGGWAKVKHTIDEEKKGCAMDMTYWEAETICKDLGTGGKEWRLCSVEELRGGACCTTGCGADKQSVWAQASPPPAVVCPDGTAAVDSTELHFGHEAKDTWFYRPSEGDGARFVDDEHGGYAELTKDTEAVGGSVFKKTPHNIAFDSSSFHIEFEVFFGKVDAWGADGIAFTVCDIDRSKDIYGDDHICQATIAKYNGMGLGSAGQPGYTIEFDTWHNKEQKKNEGGQGESTSDHVAFWFDGIGAKYKGEFIDEPKLNPVKHQCAAEAGVGHCNLKTGDWDVANIEDGDWHLADVQVGRNGPGSVRVRLDGHLVYSATIAKADMGRLQFAGTYGWTAATGTATNDHRIRNARMIQPCVFPQTPEPPAPSPPAVSGDPFIQSNDGTRVQVFLPVGQEVSLLTCKGMELRGTARGSGMMGDHQQWFQQFRVLAAGKETVTVAAVGAATLAAAKANGAGNLTTVAVAVDGIPWRAPTARETSSGALVVVSQDTSRPIGGGYAETVSVSMEAADLEESPSFEIESATASKFESLTLQALHAHLDLRFLSLNTKACTAGVLAEVWGAVPMSAATAAMLRPPSN